MGDHQQSGKPFLYVVSHQVNSAWPSHHENGDQGCLVGIKFRSSLLCFPSVSFIFTIFGFFNCM